MIGVVINMYVMSLSTYVLKSVSICCHMLSGYSLPCIIPETAVWLSSQRVITVVTKLIPSSRYTFRRRLCSVVDITS